MKNMSKTRYRSSFETDRRIIFTLALEKEFPQYDLDQRIHKDYRTVLRRTKFLEKNGLIKVAHVEGSKKGGLSKKILTLTEQGLVYTLANPQHFDSPDDLGIWPDIDRIAKNYAEMWPLLFGEWDFICENNLRNEILTRLQAAVYHFVTFLGRDWYKVVRTDDPDQGARKLKLEKMTSKELAEKFFARHRSIVPTLTNNVLGLDCFLSAGASADYLKGQAAFIRALSKNPRLQKYLDYEFEYWVTRAKIDLDQANKNYDWYQKLKKE